MNGEQLFDQPDEIPTVARLEDRRNACKIISVENVEIVYRKSRMDGHRNGHGL